MVFLGCITTRKLIYYLNRFTYISEAEMAFIISSFLKEKLKEEGKEFFLGIRKNFKFFRFVFNLIISPFC